MNKFYFRLHPLQWMFENDAQQVFRALELSDGTYLISWVTRNGVGEIFMTQTEVRNELKSNNWIKTNKNGELL